jgi:uncharacterized protein (TIGR03435 family)
VGAVLDSRQRRGRAGAILVAMACVAVAALVVMMSPLRMVAAQQLAFEVTSVKAFDSADRTRWMRPTIYPSGRFVSRFPMYAVVAYAYKLPFNRTARLSGIPDAMAMSIYDIEATGTIPAGLSSHAREDRIRMMLQSLLADRFKMLIHKEAREMPVYALVAARGGPKLQKADIEEKDCPDESAPRAPMGPATPDPDTCHSFNGGQGRGLHARAVNMADLVSYVENWTDRPLLDKTGIEGLFHIQTSPWQDMTSAPPSPGAKAEGGSDLADLPTLFQVFERLGLKMEARNDKADVYVVDHIEKPSEN